MMPIRLPLNMCLYAPTLSNPVLTEAKQLETNKTKMAMILALAPDGARLVFADFTSLGLII